MTSPHADLATRHSPRPMRIPTVCSLALPLVSLAPATPVEPVTRPVPLAQVRLLDGPFLDSLRANTAYLLTLEPDRLLHNFRTNAGLEPKGQPYGGWERDTIAGHTLGHYLTACALTFAQTGDDEFKRRADCIVAELAACQQAEGDGYVAGFTRKRPGSEEVEDGKVLFDELARGEIRSAGFDLNGCWVPFYNWHKLLNGLVDARELCGNGQALAVATGLAGFIDRVFAKLDDAQVQQVLECEHGGINESLARLHALTGDPRHLALAQRIYHKRILDPLAAGEDRLQGNHANTQIPKVIGAACIHELTGGEKFAAIARFFWQTVTDNHSYVIGGNADREYFQAPRTTSQHLTEETCESCNTHNMLRLTRHLHAWTGDARYLDYYERAHLNHILAHQHPKTGMLAYMVPMRSGSRRAFSTPFDSFWCCVGTGIENHAKHGDTIWWTRGPDELAVNLYIPSQVDWTAHHTVVRMEGAMPTGDTMTLTVHPAAPARFTLALRIPPWCADSFQATLAAGAGDAAQARADGYLRLTRTWQAGDRVAVTLPMTTRIEATPDDPDTIALLHGPNVLAADLGPADGPQPHLAPALVAEDVLAAISRTDAPGLAFSTHGIGRPADLALRPFWQLQDRRYAVYFKRHTPSGWEQHKELLAREEARRRELDSRSVDAIHLGEMQPERDHQLASHLSWPADYRGEKGRDARSGGFFEFTARVDPETPLELHCRYWGEERNRRFDILLDGTRLATEQLDTPAPGKFVDRIHPIPPELTRGKHNVRIRFQPHQGHTAGPVFGCRIVRR